MRQAFYEANKVSNFFSPHKVVLGQDTVKKVGDEARALGGSKALIVTDPGIVSAGYAQIVEDALHAAKIEVGIFDRVVPEPPARCVNEWGGGHPLNNSIQSFSKLCRPPQE